MHETPGEAQTRSGSAAHPAAENPAGPPASASLATLGANALAGLVASLLSIGYCLSFSALIFQGVLAPGLPQGLWCLLAGTAVAGLYVALTTSLPPAEAAPDNPAVAVLGVLAAAVTQGVVAAGGTGAEAVEHVLIAFSLATLVTGLVLYTLGALRLGQAVRFIPYPVIGGFLAASGWFLILGGLEIAAGRDLDLSIFASAPDNRALVQAALAVLFALAVLAAKSRSGSTYVLPVAFIGGSLLLDLALRAQGASVETSAWYISGTTDLAAWTPIPVAAGGGIAWSAIAAAWPEIAAVAGVTVIALLLDVTGLEVARARTADLDWEFRSNGAANIIAAPLGGVMGNLSMNGSRLLDETGGLARISGVFASLVIVAVLATGLDLAALVPKPVLAGLLIYLGIVVLSGVLLRSPAQRASMDLVLALAIMAAIVTQGYLTGVVFGFVAACLMFAVRYSRIAVIRRHMTRADISSNVERAPECARLLAEHGSRVHMFTLSGFIFFGSSHRVLETIRTTMTTAPATSARFIILDFADVPGFDTSALIDFVKLKHLSATSGVTLCLANANAALAAALEGAGLMSPPHSARAFPTRDSALAWCEETLLESLSAGIGHEARHAIADWLAAELGSRARADRLLSFFEPRSASARTRIYAAGEEADTIDLVIRGTVAITVTGETGIERTLRTMPMRTVVGEMGFFRAGLRAAHVTSPQGADLLTLTREAYLRLAAEEPEVARAFLELIIRILSDRLEFANRGLTALS